MRHPNQDHWNDLMQAGREVATIQMQHAVEEAKSVEQMNNQLSVLQCAAIYTLATSVYNKLMQQHIPRAITIATMVKVIEHELDFLIANESDVKIMEPRKKKEEIQ